MSGRRTPVTRPCRTCRQPFRPVGKARYCSTACRCGTDAGYNAGCRCAPCRAAHSRNHKRLRLNANPPVPALGTIRRLNALACLGWSTAELSRRLGCHRSYIQKVRGRQTLDRSTVAMIERLYDELSMTWCTGPTARRTAAAAAARGWAPPLAWDEGDLDDPAARPYGEAARQARAAGDCDDVVVDRILAGEYRLAATREERTAVARRWVAGGRSLAELARVTGWKVDRYFRLSDQEAAA